MGGTDARADRRAEPSAFKAIGVCYDSLLFIKSDNKALTLADDWAYIRLGLFGPLTTVVPESGNTERALTPHTHSVYAMNQMSKDTVILSVLSLEMSSFASSVWLLKVQKTWQHN